MHLIDAAGIASMYTYVHTPKGLARYGCKVREIFVRNAMMDLIYIQAVALYPCKLFVQANKKCFKLNFFRIPK